MSTWTKARLEQMIADGVEESLTLDYKRAAALLNSDIKKAEITKDVSAMANSAGGFLIYGIAEPNDKAKSHLPERLDPLSRADVSKEWLEQVIQTIQPRIEGIAIYPVPIDEPAGSVCYVVDIPQSHTAHQARDHVYYKRHNFNSRPMDDYEVRDVMNRKTHPVIQASIFINKRLVDFKTEGLILVKLENIGRVLARAVMVELELPFNMDGFVAVEEPVLAKVTEEGQCQQIRLTPSPGESPIFPGSDVTLRRKFNTNVGQILDKQRKPIKTTRQIKINVFADEMTPLRVTLDFAPVIMGWTAIENPPAS